MKRGGQCIKKYGNLRAGICSADLEAFLDHPSINSGRLNMGAFKDALAYAGVTALEEMCDANIT